MTHENHQTDCFFFFVKIFQRQKKTIYSFIFYEERCENRAIRVCSKGPVCFVIYAVFGIHGNIESPGHCQQQTFKFKNKF